MQSNPSLPKEIRATIHEDAIQKVSRFFNATTAECLNELLQNSRRSGATRVDITLRDNTVTVTDDGRGVQDPEALLAFGLSGWDDNTARNEDPAGMGVYALARKQDVVITSRPSQQTHPWQVRLDEQHFSGAKPAPVSILPENAVPPGTSVSFSDPKAKPDDVRVAARYYPLPVTLNGVDMARTDFLHACFHIEEWQGLLRIGVSRMSRQNHHHHRLNFHGITLHDGSASIISNAAYLWISFVDVINCPQLELTLPSRKELVRTEFLNDVSQACRAAIYRAILKWPTPVDLPKSLQEEAASLGVTIPDARPLLAPWQPETADPESPFGSTTDHRTQVKNDSLLMLPEMDPHDDQALHRALERSGMHRRIMAAEKGMQGYPWYDRIPAIQRVTTLVNDNGRTYDLAEARRQDVDPTVKRPDSITFILEITGADGKSSTMEVPADVAFFNEELCWMPARDTPLITQDSLITPQQLADLMLRSFFYPSDEADNGSEAQRDEAYDYLNTLAIATLVSKQESVKAALTKASVDHLRPELPKGWEAVIRMRPDQSLDVEVYEDAGPT